MPFNVSEILAGSAVLLNDKNLTIFTFVDQLPFFKIACEDLRQELMDNNIPISNVTSAGIIVPAGITNIGGDSNIPLPIDLIDILEVWERINNSSVSFLLMSKRAFLPKIEVPTSYFGFYAWKNQIIELPKATSNIEVKIDYIGDPLGNIVDDNTQIRVINSMNFLKYRNAALCAEFIGENKDRADSLNENAGRARDILLNISIKSSQNIFTRRRPFRARSASWYTR